MKSKAAFQISDVLQMISVIEIENIFKVILSITVLPPEIEMERGKSYT